MLLALASLVLGLGAVTQTPAHAATGPYLFQSLNGGHRCVNVTGASLANGALVIQWDCDAPLGNDQWLLDNAPGGGYRVRNVHSGKCLNVLGARTDRGAPVGQWDCGSSLPNDVWFITLTTASTTIRNAHSGWCLTIDGGLTTNGARLVQWTCSSTSTSDKWAVVN
jgi:cytochrome c